MDTELIKALLVQSNPYLAKIEELTPDTDHLQDFDSQLMAERCFEVIAQVILDICTHISSRSSFGPPSTYADCIDNLYVRRDYMLM